MECNQLMWATCTNMDDWPEPWFNDNSDFFRRWAWIEWPEIMVSNGFVWFRLVRLSPGWGFSVICWHKRFVLFASYRGIEFEIYYALLCNKWWNINIKYSFQFIELREQKRKRKRVTEICTGILHWAHKKYLECRSTHCCPFQSIGMPDTMPVNLLQCIHIWPFNHIAPSAFNGNEKRKSKQHESVYADDFSYSDAHHRNANRLTHTQTVNRAFRGKHAAPSTVTDWSTHSGWSTPRLAYQYGHIREPTAAGSWSEHGLNINAGLHCFQYRAWDYFGLGSKSYQSEWEKRKPWSALAGNNEPYKHSIQLTFQWQL